MTTIIHQITSGVAGWLTFEQMRDGVDNLREAELATPLQLIASGRGYELRGEFPLPRPAGTRGAPQCIDFLLVNHKQNVVAAIETKYKKTDKRMAGSISRDAGRLHSLTLEMIDEQITEGHAGRIKKSVAGYKLYKAVIVVWHQSSIVEHISKFEAKPIKKQFLKLMKRLVPEDTDPTSANFSKAMLGRIASRPVACSAGSLRAGSTVTRKRFWVAGFLHQNSWSKL